MQSIRTILCPTDFSEASEYGLDYAAHVAKLFMASIKLVYVRTSIWPEAIQLEHNALESAEDISARLALFCKETEEEFGVHCSQQILITTDTLEGALAEQAKDCDLIVMGTDGVENYYESVFGSNTYHVIQKTKCPLLIVPSGCLFKPIATLVYAYDPEANPIFLFNQLKSIVEPQNVAVKVVYISEENPSPEVEHKLEILRDAVMLRKMKGKDWSFDSIHSRDVSFALDQYIKHQGADMLALSFHHREFMDQLFTENIVKQITLIAEYPVLVFWH